MISMNALILALKLPKQLKVTIVMSFIFSIGLFELTNYDFQAIQDSMTTGATVAGAIIIYGVINTTYQAYYKKEYTADKKRMHDNLKKRNEVIRNSQFREGQLIDQVTQLNDEIERLTQMNQGNCLSISGSMIVNPQDVKNFKYDKNDPKNFEFNSQPIKKTTSSPLTFRNSHLNDVTDKMF